MQHLVQHGLGRLVGDVDHPVGQVRLAMFDGRHAGLFGVTPVPVDRQLLWGTKDETGARHQLRQLAQDRFALGGEGDIGIAQQRQKAFCVRLADGRVAAVGDGHRLDGPDQRRVGFRDPVHRIGRLAVTSGPQFDHLLVEHAVEPAGPAFQVVLGSGVDFALMLVGRLGRGHVIVGEPDPLHDVLAGLGLERDLAQVSVHIRKHVLKTKGLGAHLLVISLDVFPDVLGIGQRVEVDRLAVLALAQEVGEALGHVDHRIGEPGLGDGRVDPFRDLLQPAGRHVQTVVDGQDLQGLGAIGLEGVSLRPGLGEVTHHHRRIAPRDVEHGRRRDPGRRGTRQHGVAPEAVVERAEERQAGIAPFLGGEDQVVLGIADRRYNRAIFCQSSEDRLVVLLR